MKKSWTPFLQNRRIGLRNWKGISFFKKKRRRYGISLKTKKARRSFMAGFASPIDSLCKF